MASRPTSDLLFWLDMEMTGLDAKKERIIEIAAVITDGQLELVAQGPDLVVHQSEALLDGMDDWNTEKHNASGLVERVRMSSLREEDAEKQVLEFLARHAPERTVPLAGNSVHQDRLFLMFYMPKLEAYLHYRNVDVSSIKELVRRWYPGIYGKAPLKKQGHRAMEDIHESIAELRYYREAVFNAAS